jgi:hypothetical protein
MYEKHAKNSMNFILNIVVSLSFFLSSIVILTNPRLLMNSITDIIYNEPTSLVSAFKDYLILDDISEFLKRSYSFSESIARLPKVINFYVSYSKVFPNYINIKERAHMFKNIERKQRWIDERQRDLDKFKREKEERRKTIKEYGYLLER